MTISDRVAARYMGVPIPTAHRKTAAFPPMPPKEEGSSLKRNIPKGHPFDKRALKPLSKALWASTVALGHALTAYRHLSRLKSTTVSPDGQLGGQGYVMRLADMRKKLFDASEALSSISDTIFDEIQAPHWKPQLAQLDESDLEDVSRLVEESQENMENPEKEAEEGIDEIEEYSSKKPKAEASELPDADEGLVPPVDRFKQASSDWGISFNSIYANSSEPVSEMSGGPRVDHLGPGNGTGLYGDYIQQGGHVPWDQWSADGGGLSRRDEGGEDYDYTSEFENEMPATASSGMPQDTTPTDAWDFGIGFGAYGDGAGDYANPSTEDGYHGVAGPSSTMPGSPPQSTGDNARVWDTTLNMHAALYGMLPQDVAGPPARSDYYPGKKDNLVSVGQSELPELPRSEGISAPSLVDTYYKSEDLDTDYTRYDYTTRNLRLPHGTPGQEHQEPWAVG